ncbi:MAG: response regulator [Rhodoferax sp.]|nr:response regulator [Rhodoferax sp.]
MHNPLRLPFNPNAGQTMIYQSVPPPHRVVMVIASDQANFQLVTQLIARRDDLKLLAATQGKPGVEMTSARQPDVVVMDTSLSDIGGLEALKMLRDNFSTSHIPVIALSSDALQKHIDQGLKAGFYRYLTKPFRLMDLLDAIDEAVRFNPRNIGPGLSPSNSARGDALGRHASSP